jgi:hypothetical protein
MERVQVERERRRRRKRSKDGGVVLLGMPGRLPLGRQRHTRRCAASVVGAMISIKRSGKACWPSRATSSHLSIGPPVQLMGPAADQERAMVRNDANHRPP